MNKTPQANRTHIGIFGEINAGKSSLFNAITNTDISIISNVRGTTTDPVKKAMELLPFGPVVFIDTAGLNDKSDLGEKRVKKTNEVISKIDYALYLADINEFGIEEYEKTLEKIKKFNVKHTLVFTKIDKCSKEKLNTVKEKYPKAIFINTKKESDIENFKAYLSAELEKYTEKENSLLGNLISPNSNVILVAPQDSEAPKGRLILPQAQLIRDCLDNNILCQVCNLDTLGKTLEITKKVDLVVTDSQVFKEVEKIIPNDVLLTSFSILYANQKGEAEKLKQGVEFLNNLKENDTILMAEVCTHSVSHEDIGRIKIPKMLQDKTKLKLNFEFVTGKDFDVNLSKYSMVVHCGGCMITRKEMLNRIMFSHQNDTPITNYGMLIAYCTGILDRSIELLYKKNL